MWVIADRTPPEPFPGWFDCGARGTRSPAGTQVSASYPPKKRRTRESQLQISPKNMKATPQNMKPKNSVITIGASLLLLAFGQAHAFAAVHPGAPLNLADL